MSLLNFHFEQDRALIAVDTNSSELHGQRQAELSKLFHLAHQNVVFAARGLQPILWEVFAGAVRTTQANDLDAIEQWLFPQLDSACKRLIADHFGGGAVPQMPCELLVAGWSASRGRMVGLRYSSDDAATQPFAMKVVESWGFAPAYPIGAIPGLNTADAMAAVAKQQIAHMQRTHPTTAIGGRLIVCSLTRASAAFDSIAL